MIDETSADAPPRSVALSGARFQWALPESFQHAGSRAAECRIEASEGGVVRAVRSVTANLGWGATQESFITPCARLLLRWLTTHRLARAPRLAAVVSGARLYVLVLDQGTEVPEGGDPVGRALAQLASAWGGVRKPEHGRALWAQVDLLPLTLPRQPGPPPAR